MPRFWVQDQDGDLVRIEDARAIRVLELAEGDETHGVFVEYADEDDISLYQGDEEACKAFLHTIMQSLTS